MNPLNTAWRAAIARPRLLLAIGVGAGAYVVLLATSLAGVTRSVLAWDVGVTVFLASSLHLFVTEPLAQIAAHARQQEEGEWTVFAITLCAAAISLVAIIGEYGVAKAADHGRGVHEALVAYTLLASWLMTHFTFGYRYAHEYYTRTGASEMFDGGLDFPKEDKPDYLDFLYFALVLGMTFQVSDVQITSRKLRRLATLHGLIAFIFSTVILALTVNLAASLL